MVRARRAEGVVSAAQPGHLEDPPPAPETSSIRAGMQQGPFPSLETALDLVGVAGFEPTASSSRIRIVALCVLGGGLYALLMALLAIGLRRPSSAIDTRSTPQPLPNFASGSVHGLCGHPVAQASLSLAAPAGARWSTPRLTDLAPAGAVWQPPVRDVSSGHPASPSRPGPGRVALAAGGPFRVVGPEALPAGGISRPACTCGVAEQCQTDRSDIGVHFRKEGGKRTAAAARRRTAR